MGYWGQWQGSWKSHNYQRSWYGYKKTQKWATWSCTQCPCKDNWLDKQHCRQCNAAWQGHGVGAVFAKEGGTEAAGKEQGCCPQTTVSFKEVLLGQKSGSATIEKMAEIREKGAPEERELAAEMEEVQRAFDLKIAALKARFQEIERQKETPAERLRKTELDCKRLGDKAENARKKKNKKREALEQARARLDEAQKASAEADAEYTSIVEEKDAAYALREKLTRLGSPAGKVPEEAGDANKSPPAPPEEKQDQEGDALMGGSLDPKREGESSESLGKRNLKAQRTE